LEQTLSLHLLAGDWARARGDAALAAAEYGLVFSAINDYGVFGLGSYGLPHRAWYVFHRHSLPADLIPQFARADITAAMDERFAWLARAFAEQDAPEAACLVAARVQREAPASLSADYWAAHCQ
jgi:hypothetical protein